MRVNRARDYSCRLNRSRPNITRLVSVTQYSFSFRRLNRAFHLLYPRCLRHRPIRNFSLLSYPQTPTLSRSRPRQFQSSSTRFQTEPFQTRVRCESQGLTQPSRSAPPRLLVSSVQAHRTYPTKTRTSSCSSETSLQLFAPRENPLRRSPPRTSLSNTTKSRTNLARLPYLALPPVSNNRRRMQTLLCVSIEISDTLFALGLSRPRNSPHLLSKAAHCWK